MSTTTCILCGIKFDPVNNTGSLTCRYHPLARKRDTYPCCGASIDPVCRKRYENPKYHRGRRVGCVPIDHVASLAEFEALKKKPFVLSVTKPSAPHVKYKTFQTMEELNVHFQLKMPIGMPSVEVNLRDEYLKLTHPDDTNALDYMEEDDERFQGFYLIRRVDFQQDSDMLSEIGHSQE